MADLICCRDCCSTSCRGCNVKTLDDLLESGILDKFMDEHNTIRKEKIVDAAPVVHSKWIKSDFLHIGANQYRCSECWEDEWWLYHFSLGDSNY